MSLKVRVLITCLTLGSTAFAAPPPIQSLPITTPEPLSTTLLNLTAPFTKTNLPPTNLPNNFFNFHIYGTPITVQFYNANANFPPSLTRDCLQQAASTCNAQHIFGLDNTPVGTHALLYSSSSGTTSESVHLVLSPQPQLTWATWGKVVNALFIVQEYIEYKEVYFVILWDRSPGPQRVDGEGRMWETRGR